MDVLRLIQGTVMPGIGVGRDAVVRLHQNSGKVSALGPQATETGDGDGNVMEIAAAATVTSVPVKQSYMFPLRLGRLWPGGGPAPKRESREAAVVERNVESPASATEQQTVVERQTDNWVLKILRVRSLWPEREEATMEEEVAESDLRDAADAGDRCVGCGCAEDSEECVVGEDEEESKVFDQETFSRLLRRVSLVETQLYAKMSYLGCLAYDIPKMKPRNLHKYHGLRFVTSSFDKRRKSVHSKEDKKPAQDGKLKETKLTFEAENGEKWKEISTGISASTAYQVAATAASYLQSQTEGMLPSGGPTNVKKSNRRENEGSRMSLPEEASFIATTSSVTAVVAGKEEKKQAVAEDLNSAKSSPCEWYICDDDNSATRYIVFQGSETLASWQANLLFEPVQFEGFDVLVHRGIYEAAKGIYKQMLPEIKAHLKDRGGSATLRFTGHSLGGSLAMLLNLMLLIRGDAPVSSLLPVITFGAPSVMCQGNYLLHKLGLPRSHVQAIAMHRDIVPRAFSCNYPDHVAKILKAVNGKFRNHPCLVNQKYLYAPMGNFLILQPEENFSPHHHLLPPGSGLYILDNSWADSDDSTRLLRGAQSAFINSPHPLEILSDLTAYGSEGTVYRDHDMSSYLKSLRSVIRDELKLIRKAKREFRHDVWWPLVATPSSNTSVATAQHTGLTNSNQHQFNFASVINVSKQTFQRFGRLAASQHMHLLVVILFPARLLLLDTLISY